MPEQADSAIAAAERFWNRYEIPYEHDTAIKVRRSGLLRGSSGTGHARDTVVHLHVKEAFTDGRLARSDDSWLCENDSYVPTDGREERFVEGGEEYVPPVTCETCLDRMERWKAAVTDGGVSEGGGKNERVEPFSGEPADTPDDDELPPAKKGSINQILELSVGDRVHVETSGSYAPDRTLTVESIGSDKHPGGLLETRGEDPGYVLSGYGTKYHLITTGTPYWRAVDIVFPSQPVGQRVASVEVVEEADHDE